MAYPKLTPIIAKGATEPRYLEDRFADVINVKDFGVKGDGVADDYANLQAAIDAIGGTGKTLFLPAGKYRLETGVVLYSNIKFVGEAGTEIVRDFDIGTTGHAALIGIDPLEDEETIYNVEIRNIVFDGGGVAHPTTSFDILAFGLVPSYDIVVDNCTFKDVIDFHAIDIMRVSRMSITNCKFIGYANPNAADHGWAAGKREAIQFDMGALDDTVRNNNIRIENCYFGPSENYGSWATGIGNHGYLDTSDKCHDIIIKNNVFDGVLYCAVTCMGLENVLIEGNTVKSVTNGIHCIARHNTDQNTKAPCKNVKIVNNKLENIAVSPTNTNAIYIWCSGGADISTVDGAFNNDIQIKNNTIEKFNFGVISYCGEDVLIESNIIKCGVGYNGCVYKTKISNNIIYPETGVGIYATPTNNQLSNATSNVEYNKDFVVEGNVFVNPVARAVHVSGAGKKNIKVSNNIIVDEATGTTATGNTYNYIAVDSTRTNSVIENNTIYAAAKRGTTAVIACADTIDFPLNNKYYIGGVLDLAYANYSVADVLSNRCVIHCFNEGGTTWRGGLLFDESTRLLGLLAANGDLLIGGGSSSLGAFSRVAIGVTADGTKAVRVDSSGFYPVTNNNFALGGSSNKWTTVYANTGSINTSDIRLKQQISDIPEAVLKAWGEVNFKQFKFNDAVAKKGESARIHVGVIAQQIQEIFAKYKVDPEKYGLFCFDSWDDEYEDVEVVDVEAVYNEAKDLVSPAVTHVEHRCIKKAGEAYSIRYEEALALECAYQRWRLKQLEERVNQLTNSNN